MSSKEISLALSAMFFFLMFLIIGPFFTIWSLNTVFGTQIPLNFQTWCAVVWLLTVLNGIKFSVKNS